MGLQFISDVLYDIAAGADGTDITSVDLSGGVKGGGGSYTFSKTNGPAWLNVSADGKIIGTRSGTASKTTAVISVTDSNSVAKSITIRVGKYFMLRVFHPVIRPLHMISRRQ